MSNKMIRCMGCMSIIDEEQNCCPYCGYQLTGGEQNGKALKPGTILNEKYTVGKVLGEGGFGITYLGWDSIFNTKIAIKEYYPNGMVIRDVTLTKSTLQLVSGTEQKNFEDGLERYVNEARMLSKFSNLPGIVSVKDFFYANGTAYIVMEYIDGISLKEYLKKKGGRISAQETLELMKPVLSSLDVVHKNHLLHRDISPDNIMIGKDGVVKLIDFGAARYFESDYEKSMTVVLKHGYAPVEQYYRSGNRGEWTDIYSLCATMYRMVTGVVPVESIARLEEDKLIPINKYKKVKAPRFFRKAIEQGMSVNAKDRQQDLYELYQQLYDRTNIKNEKIKKFLLIEILLLITVLVIGLVIGGFYLARRNSDNRSAQVASVLDSLDDEDNDTEGQEEDKQETTNNTVAKEQSTAETENSTAEAQQPVAAAVEPAEVLTQESDAADMGSSGADVEHQIMVARDGTLHIVGESYTVGEIFDSYSDRPGTWQATDYDSSGTAYVYYTGTKNGKTFTIEFEVSLDDKFVITGASENDQPVEDYNTYVQQILSEVGV